MNKQLTKRQENKGFFMAYPPLDRAMRQNLIDIATQTVVRSYAPYSKFHVGAAVLSAAGHIFTGTNVENISYGLTNCAERVAVAHAVTQEGPHLRIRAIAVACSAKIPLAPCGACRQVIQEFGPGAIIIHPGPQGFLETSLEDLLPSAFDEFVYTQENGHVIRIQGNT